MKLELKKVIKDCFNYCKENFISIICLFNVIVIIIVISFALAYSDKNVSSSNSENATLTSFDSGDIGDLPIEYRSSIYFEFGNVVFNHSGSRLVSVAPLSLYYDVYDGFYLGYPVADSNSSYHYNFTSVSNLANTSLTLPIACYIADYSSDIWSISSRIDFDIISTVLPFEFMTNVSSISKSFYVSVVPSLPLVPVDYGYGITNSFLFHYLDTNNINYGSINVYQLDDQVSTIFDYSYNYDYVPLSKIVGSNYDYVYNQGSLSGYDNGYSQGYYEGYNDGYDDGIIGDNPFDAIIKGFNSLMNINMFGTVSIGDLLLLALGIVLFGGLLKVFRF